MVFVKFIDGFDAAIVHVQQGFVFLFNKKQRQDKPNPDLLYELCVCVFVPVSVCERVRNVC